MTDNVMFGRRMEVAALALARQLPSIHSFDQEVEDGLMSFGPAADESYRRAAALADAILKGARPADLPVEEPTRFTLRAAGHDVTTVVEMAPGAKDDAVIELALREARIFVTEDSDFGQLVYAAGKPAPGVIMLRFPSTARAGLPARLVEIVAQHSEKFASASSWSSPDGSVSGPFRKIDHVRRAPSSWLAPSRARVGSARVNFGNRR